MASALMVGTSPNDLQEIPNPTDISFGIKDVSSADAGRTNDANATMHKNRVATKRTLNLTWKNLDGAKTKTVLRAFKPEYVFVRYVEPEDNAFVTKEFYAGDRSAAPSHYVPTSQFTIGGVVYKTISFNIIER